MDKISNALYSFALVFITAVSAKFFTFAGLDYFYDTLIISQLTPEQDYFSYIWLFNYFLLFLSFYIVLESKKSIEQFKEANYLFILLLFMQVLWTFSFFYMEQIVISAIVIVLLDIVAGLMLHTFFYINKWSFILLIPYLLWILFASYLNIFISMMN
jgi:tryptophan-rich sensory protein